MPEQQRLPDVVIIGAAKSGTSSLARRLDKHPQVCLSKDKEPEFFSHDEKYSRGLGWYADQFAAAQPGQLCLDASTSYSRSPQYPKAAERLHRHCPGAKLIYLMRHPIDRAFSHFIHRHNRELKPGQPFDVDFETHVASDPVCLDSSDYKFQIEQYMRFYPRDSFIFLFSDEFMADELGTFKRVCDFTGIEFDSRHFPPVASRVNTASDYREGAVRASVTASIRAIPVIGKAAYLAPRPLRSACYRALRWFGGGKSAESRFTPPSIRPETRARLLERYRPALEWVAELTGRDLSSWML
tara:strand:+ start:129 stop:1022 length:894 start_codon:yes stop_codon:yes gene_type:complete